MAQLRKMRVTVLAVAVAGVAMLITAKNVLELRREARQEFEQRSAPAQNRVLAGIEADMAKPGGSLADAAAKLPFQFNGGYLLVYTDNGVLLTAAGGSSAPGAAASTMVAAQQSGNESVAYERWEGREWCMRGVPIRAAGAIAGAIVFLTDASQVSAAAGPRWALLLIRNLAAVVLATLLLLGVVWLIAPHRLKHGRWALVRVSSRRRSRSQSSQPGIAIAPPATGKAAK
jgi:hypothetical protein